MEQENNLDVETREEETEKDELCDENSEFVEKKKPAARSPEPEAFDDSRESLGRKPTPEIAGTKGGLELLMDVNLEMTVELGRAKLSIGEVMEMTQGSVIELDKMAGEPVDVRVNGILLAQGEVIVMDDIFGVRITRLNQRVDHSQLLS